MIPTHYQCPICESNFYVVTDRRKKHTCEKCNQEYRLIPTKYGGVLVLIGKDGTIYSDIFKSIRNQQNMFQEEEYDTKL